MASSSPLARAHHRSGGFTLLEMLVVLAIMGLIAGGIVLHGALHSTRADLDAAREAAAGAIRTERDDALLSGSARALRLSDDGHTITIQTRGGQTSASLGRVDAGPAGWRALLRPDGTALVPRLELREGPAATWIAADPLTGRILQP